MGKRVLSRGGKMRRLTLLSLVASFAFAGQVLVEDYTEGTKPMPFTQDSVLAQVVFTLDTNAMVLVTTGGISKNPCASWLRQNSDSISISTLQFMAGQYWSHARSQVLNLNKGSYTIGFHMRNTDAENYMQNAILQVLIFLPDKQEAVMETPTNPGEVPKSIISTGSPVTIDGVIAIFDATGRKVENCISIDRLDVSSLNAGQYFATSEGGHTTRVTVIK